MSGTRRGRPSARVIVAIVAVVVAVVVVGMLVLRVVRGGDEPVPEPLPTLGSEQATLLIQVRDDAELGADNMVVGVDGGLPAAQVLVASQLLVDLPPSGPQTLARTARSVNRSASQDALRDLLSLRVDGTLSLARLALAGMVDFVGGITVDVDATITATDEQTGQKVVVVPAGTQHLDGTAAASYALAWLPGEPESARLDRYSQVMTATVAALPASVLRIEQMLTSLGGSARTTTSTSQVARFLLRMRAGVLAGDQRVQVLATQQPATGELTLVRLDLPAADAQLAALLPTALLADDEAKPRVLLRDGVGEPGSVTAARDALVGAGLVALNDGNAETLGGEPTSVVVPPGAAGADLGDEIARALGLPATAITSSGSGTEGADAVVVLGSDFEP